MTIPFILATMFAVGVIGTVIGAVWFFIAEGSWGLALGLFLIGFPMASLLAFAPFGMFAAAQSPILVALRKGEWECTASHRVFIGKTLVTKCDQYNRSVK